MAMKKMYAQLSDYVETSRKVKLSILLLISMFFSYMTGFYYFELAAELGLIYTVISVTILHGLNRLIPFLRNFTDSQISSLLTYMFGGVMYTVFLSYLYVSGFIPAPPKISSSQFYFNLKLLWIASILFLVSSMIIAITNNSKSNALKLVLQSLIHFITNVVISVIIAFAFLVIWILIGIIYYGVGY